MFIRESRGPAGPRQARCRRSAATSSDGLDLHKILLLVGPTRCLTDRGDAARKPAGLLDIYLERANTAARLANSVSLSRTLVAHFLVSAL